MAFADGTTNKYDHSFTAVGGAAYSWEIHKDGYDSGLSGTTTLVAKGRGHIRTTWTSSEREEFAPLMPSSTTVQFYDTTGGDVLADVFDDLVEQDYNYALFIKDNGGNILWRGFLETGEVQAQEDGPASLTLTANDGLGRLEDIPYVAVKATNVLYTGRDTVTSVLADILAEVGWGINIYEASNLYPRHASAQLTAAQNPLDNVYVDRYTLRDKSKREDAQDVPVSCKAALEAVLRRFGLQVMMYGGAWHILQKDLLYNSTYRRWLYDSTGAAIGSPNYADYSHGITPVTESIERTEGTIQALLPYSAVRMDYQHGPIKLIQNPQFDYAPFSVTPSGWTLNPAAQPAAVRAVMYTGTNVGVRINAINQTASLPSTQGTAPGSWNAAIAAAISGNSSGTVATVAVVELEDGTQVMPSVEFLIEANPGFSIPGIDIGYVRRAVTAQVKIVNGGTTKYLQEDNSWDTDVCWLNRPVVPGWQTWVITTATDALPAGGPWTLTFTLGPVFEQALVVYGSGAVYVVDSVLYDNADVAFVLPDGTFNPDLTSTINYVSRDKPAIKTVTQYLGDGPTAANDASLTMNAAAPLDVTSDWEEGAITGSASGDSIDELLSRIHLRAQRNPRRTHNAAYYAIATLPGPINTIVRSGSRYGVLSMTRDWEGNYVSGEWVKIAQDGFMDDLEAGVYSDGQTLGAFAGGDNAGFILQQLATTFFTEASKRIAVTTAAIPATSVNSISVASVYPDTGGDGIVEPLLKAGDQVVIISPDLSYNVVELSADQAAGATSIAIDSYSFPAEVPYPASIFFIEEELLTLARLGEQGFAVTVQAKPIGKINGNQSGTVTTLNVKEWIGSVDSGEYVYLENGTRLTLTADVRSGASSIAFTSTAVGTLLDDDPIFAQGQVRRSEFLVTSDKITAYIERTGDQIATVSAGGNDVTPPYTIATTATTHDLFVGDYIYVAQVNSPEEEPGSLPGTVNKRMISVAAPAGATTLTISAALQVFPGDVITPGYVAGQRIDADGITYRHSHIKSENWNGTVDDAGVISNVGTTGWIISKSGEAVFSDVTVRGTVTNSGGDYVIDEDGIELTLVSGNVYDAAKAITWDGYVRLEAYTAGTGQAVTEFVVRINDAFVGDAPVISFYADELKFNGDAILTDSAGLNGAAALTDPGADRLLFWDESANTVAWLTLGTNLSITGTTINATGGAGVATLDDVGDVALTAVAQGDILYRNGAGEWANLPAGTSGRVLKTQGAGANPLWGTLAVSDLSDGANVAHINATETISAAWTFNQSCLKLTNVTSGITYINAGDPAGDRTFTLPTVSGTIYATGNTDVSVADGGTGVSTLALNGILYGNATSAVQVLAVNATGTNKFLRQVSSGAPSWEQPAAADLSDGANIAHINASETITAAWKFNLTRLTLENVTTGVTTLNAGDAAGNITLTLPATAGTLALTGSFAAVSHTHAATDITSGTLDDARLSSTVANLNAAETISAVWQYQQNKLALQNVTSNLTTLNAGDAAGNITLTLPIVTSTLLGSEDSINALADVTITSAAEGHTLVHDGSVWINAAPAWHNLYSMYSQDSSGANTQASLLNGSALGSKTIAANTLKAGTVIHFRAWGFVTTDTEDLTLRFFFNTTGSGTEAFSLAGPTTNSLSQVAWTLDVWMIVKTAGAGGTLQLSGRYWVNGAEAAVTPAHITSQQESIDTTVANTIELTAQWTAAGASTVYCDHAAIDMTRQAF